jgi:hypothetical protein
MQLALLTRCYSTQTTGWPWTTVAMRDIATVSSVGVEEVDGGDGEAGDAAALCLVHALELVHARRSALPALRLLRQPPALAPAHAPQQSVTRDATDASTMVTGSEALVCALFCAGHLLGALPAAAERLVLLQWLRATLMSQRHRFVTWRPLASFLIAAILHEQHSSEGRATSEVGLAVVEMLDVARSSSVDPAKDAPINSMDFDKKGWLGRVSAELARPFAIMDRFWSSWWHCFTNPAETVRHWFETGDMGAARVGDGPSVTTGAACSVAFLFHPCATTRRRVAKGLAESDPDGELASMYLPTVLHALNTEDNSATAVALLHQIPALSTRRKAAIVAFRYLQQLLNGGMSIGLCTILLAKLWRARSGSSGHDDIFAVLNSAIRCAVASSDVEHQVAAAKAIEIVCHQSPQAGIALVAPCCNLLQAACGAPSIAVNCLALLCQAQELRCLPVIHLLQRSLRNGLELLGTDDRAGPGIVKCLVCLVQDYHVCSARAEKAEKAMQDLASEQLHDDHATTEKTAAVFTAMDGMIESFWRFLDADCPSQPLTRVAVFRALADLVAEGVETDTLITRIDAPPTRDQTWLLLQTECTKLCSDATSSASSASVSVCQQLASAVLVRQRASCSRVFDPAPQPAKHTKGGSSQPLQRRLRGRIAWYSNAPVDVICVGLLWCYHPPPPKDKAPKGQPVPRRHLVARAHGYRDTLRRLLIEVGIGGDSWLFRQYLGAGKCSEWFG